MNAELQNEQRQRLRALAEASGLDLSTLAARAGIAPSTLTRFMNAPVKHVLSARTWARLEAAIGKATVGAVLSTDERVEAVYAVADVLGVDLLQVGALTPRQREWMTAIEQLPAAAEDQTLNLVRGIGHASTAANQQSGPSERTRRRRTR